MLLINIVKNDIEINKHYLRLLNFFDKRAFYRLSILTIIFRRKKGKNIFKRKNYCFLEYR